ncbi:MAG: protoheme IX farnesyltransferase [Planctomycetota bacterium]|nr:MAG: protoheme IX farnesyltransferase [Planctomycetota bacterium]
MGGSATAYASRASDLLALTKPGIGFLVVLTALAGYWIAAPAGAVELDTLLALLAGTALVGAGANAGNMLLERRHDARMRRTANRPLPAGRLRPITAAGFMAVLTLGGLALLWAGTGPLPTALGGLAWLLYLAAYTPMKRRTSLNTLVGAIPGALPPLMGWAAARGGIDPMGLVLFAILFLWQIPHFFAIAELYADDYRQAGYAMLPVTQAGASSAARLGALYCSALLPVTLLPVALGHAGRLYLLCAVTLGLAFLLAGLAHAIGRSRPRARRLFLLSLLYLPSLLATLAIDRI